MSGLVARSSRPTTPALENRRPKVSSVPALVQSARMSF
jgi:hypothetical protein